MKRIFAVLMAVAMAITFMPLTTEYAEAKIADTTYSSIGETETIFEGDAVTVKTTSSVNGKWFAFAPEETDIYTIQTTGSYDTYGAVYEIRDNVYFQLNSDDDSGNGMNFRIDCQMNSGNTYYIAASMHSADKAGSFVMSLSGNSTGSSSCVHEWRSGYVYDDEPIDNETHGDLIEYYCGKCDGSKSTYINIEPHDWDCYRDGLQCTYYNESQHKLEGNIRCEDCGKRVTGPVYQEHDFDKYGICDDCDYPTEDVTLSEGQWTAFSGEPYLRIDIDRTGYITVESSTCLDLYNSDKRCYSDTSAYANEKTCIAVKPGTYYLHRDDRDNSKVKYEFTYVANQSNNTRSKAYLFSKDSKKKIVCYPSSKNVYRWYKIKLGSKKRIYLNSYSPNSNLYYEVYSSKGKNLGYFDHLSNEDDHTVYVTNKKFAKGTYYIRVKPWSMSYAERTKTTGNADIISWY